VTLQTREPTGKPPWPIIAVAGVEKSGKSWSLAEASGSELIGRTLWISAGEDDPDEYGAVPGARFEIVLHDGTYRDILRAVNEAVEAPRATDGRPTLIGLDSGTTTWDLIKDLSQQTANARASRKQKRNVTEADVTSDLWNIATQRWRNILNALRRHDGPVVITARLDEVTVFENGQPTKTKAWKVQGQKNLPYDVGAIVELPARGEAYLTGVRSVKAQQKQPRVKLDEFTLDTLWRYLGLDVEGATAPRQHSATVLDQTHAEDTADAARDALRAACAFAGRDTAAVAAIYESRHGVTIRNEDDPEPIRALIAEISRPAEATS
jgi:hypothetical protein